MKNKKLIEIINNFPYAINKIRKMLTNENADYIMDASEYEEPASLLTITNPQILMLNLKMAANSAIEMVATEMQSQAEIKLGMITRSLATYYLNLCCSLKEEFFMETANGLKLIPGSITAERMN